VCANVQARRAGHTPVAAAARQLCFLWRRRRQQQVHRQLSTRAGALRTLHAGLRGRRARCVLRRSTTSMHHCGTRLWRRHHQRSTPRACVRAGLAPRTAAAAAAAASRRDTPASGQALQQRAAAWEPSRRDGAGPADLTAACGRPGGSQGCLVWWCAKRGHCVCVVEVPPGAREPPTGACTRLACGVLVLLNPPTADATAQTKKRDVF
jgi:hypothetical protein